MPHKGVPAGITVCLTRYCLQASAGVNGLIMMSNVCLDTCFEYYIKSICMVFVQDITKGGSVGFTSYIVGQNSSI